MSDLLCICIAAQPQNILLTCARPLGDIRIVDFGLSRRMDSVTEVREILGTPEYVGESALFLFAAFFLLTRAASQLVESHFESS